MSERGCQCPLFILTTMPPGAETKKTWFGPNSTAWFGCRDKPCKSDEDDKPSAEDTIHVVDPWPWSSVPWLWFVGGEEQSAANRDETIALVVV